MKQTQRTKVEFYALNLLSVLSRMKNETGRLEGMDDLYTTIQPFTAGDFSRPKTRLQKARRGLLQIEDQIDAMRFDTFMHILCDNLNAYLRDISQALMR